MSADFQITIRIIQKDIRQLRKLSWKLAWLFYRPGRLLQLNPKLLS